MDNLIVKQDPFTALAIHSNSSYIVPYKSASKTSDDSSKSTRSPDSSILERNDIYVVMLPGGNFSLEVNRKTLFSNTELW